eukprot:GGOE01019205.1.p1 GENE.GGOE01019205.1~~GGOE01019205.1.p1  ORF type:complete len:364 (+),score=120.66 GGOE01019205.1:77-1168(+)
MSLIPQQLQDADAQLTLCEEEATARQLVGEEEVQDVMSVLRQRVFYEAAVGLMRIYCTLKANPLRDRRFCCCTVKVPQDIGFPALVGLLQRRFQQELLFTFTQPEGHGFHERLLTPFNIQELKAFGHLRVPHTAPKPCHLPTLFLKGRLGKLNPTLPSPFLPATVNVAGGSTAQHSRSPPNTLSPLHTRLFEQAAEARQKREARRRQVDEELRQEGNKCRPLRLQAESALVRRMHDEAVESMAEAAAKQRQQEREEWRRRQRYVTDAELESQVAHFFESDIHGREEAAQKLEEKWRYKPPVKALAEEEKKEVAGRLYATAAENHHEVARRQIYDEVYKANEVRSGPQRSTTDMETTFERLYKS